MTVLKSLENALEFLESLGYRGGDIHDNLEEAIFSVADSYVADLEVVQSQD